MQLSIQPLAALECICEGTSSIIYRQDTSEYGVPVIVKVAKHAYPTPRQVVQLATEYAMTRDLDLPGTRKAYESGTIDDRPALVLEYVEGETVRQAFSAQHKSLAEVLAVAVSIVQAVAEIHHHNIIHKNINSHHILVDPGQQRATIIDFGIASQIDLRTRHPEIPDVLEGTLAYISPEQTGRMNRSVDCRSDLYSLGVVLYEMLTGRLPFPVTDASQLVHCHIARRPPPVHEVSPDTPRVVSDIVMRLLAKDPGDRYQSALGLRADLESCRDQLEATGTIQDFALASADPSERFEIPQKLYGREQEMQTLTAAFHRVRHGASEIVLVSGPPAVGKSWLVHELDRSVAEEGGYLVSASCEQQGRSIPHDALARALSRLVNLLLTEGEDRLARWKAKILQAVGDHGQVLLEVIPRLEWIIGRQPPVQELSLADAQQRLVQVARSFVRAIAEQEHPLVIFIDDLQWVDVASLDLLRLLMTDERSHHLLLIGAYRDDQVGASHPLLQLVTGMEQEALSISTVRLQRLSNEAVKQLLADALRCEPSDAQSLAELVCEKTGGNAFFVTELLQSLYEEGLLRLSSETRRWEWDITRVRDRVVTDDVATLMTHKIETLPERTREMLMLAACMGSVFTLKTLATIAAQPAKTAFAWLWPAVEERLVLPLDDSYKVMLAWTHAEPPAVDCQFEFSHSRVRQAAYSLMPTRRKRAVHLAIGRLRLQEAEETGLEERIFDIVDQLNEGFRYIHDEAERLRLAELNLIAGRKAKSGAAYQAAIWYLSMGIGLLPPERWERHYQLTHNLYTEAVEAEYLSANLERARMLCEEALQQARDVRDKIRVYRLQILVYSAQNQNAEATETALTALETLGLLSPAELAFTPLAEAETPALLDTATVIKASHMLSQEIHLEQLLDRMIHIVIESAGAEKGMLIEVRDGSLVIQARGQVGQRQVETMQALPVEDSGEVPLSVVNYVARTQTPVVLRDACRDSTYAADRFIAENQIRSLLCLPIVHQAKLLGLLYLENNLAANVFTPDRLELLKALSSQAAISMQNASLYASLEHKIRELEQAEQALKNSERRLADIIDFLPDATFAVDLQGRVILWNRAAEAFTGTPAADMLGKGDCEYAIPFYGERRPVLIDLLLNSAPEIERRYQGFKREDERIYGESYTLNARREEVYLRGVAAPLYDSQGNVIGAIETIHDISERKRADVALKESETRYRTLFEESPVSLWEEDFSEVKRYIDGLRASGVTDYRSYFESHPEAVRHCASLVKVLDINKATLALARAGGKEELLAGLSSLFTEESLGVFCEELIALAEGEYHFESEAVHGTLTGERISAVLLVSVVPGHEESFERVLVSIQDITKRVQAEEELRRHREHLEDLVAERTAELVTAREQAEAASHAKSAFLTSMSHELRTPLNAILGFAQILQRRSLDPDIIDKLKIVQRSGEHLLTLINDILDLARIEAGKMNLAPAPIQLSRFLEDIASLIHSRGQAKGLTFSYERLNVLPAAVQADETRLRQVLLNLLGNAVKFTGDGQVILRVKRITESATEPPAALQARQPAQELTCTLAFEVEDTGIGIPPDQLDRIFEPFEQVRDHLRTAEGTGLGLAISRQLVHMMGGEIGVESKVGRGSTFWFTVSLPMTEETFGAVQPRDRRITGYTGARRTVLVVDDVPSNRAMLVELLKSMAFEVVEAVNGQQALLVAMEQRPDLILMDRYMPVVDGFEAAHQIRKRPELRDVPMIAVSASVSAEDQAWSREVGFDAFLPKPVPLPDLTVFLQEHLGLEWEYAEEGGNGAAEQDDRSSSALPPGSPASLVSPPQEELAILLDLALLGDMRGIRERAAYIETLGEQYVPFTSKLRELTKSFNARAILALLKRYAEDDE